MKKNVGTIVGAVLKAQNVIEVSVPRGWKGRRRMREPKGDPTGIPTSDGKSERRPSNF